jgi:AraC-like DNA-binding protein
MSTAAATEAVATKRHASSRRRRSLLAYFFVSNLLIACAIIVTNSIAYVISLRVIESEITKAHEASLGQVQRSIDQRLQDIEQLATEVGLNRRIEGLANLREELQPFHRFTLVEIMQDLGSYDIANAFIDDLSLYFKHHGFVITKDGRREYDFSYLSAVLPADPETGSLRSVLDRHVGSEYAFVYNAQPANADRAGIMFLQSIPIDDVERSDAVLAIVIDYDNVQALLRETEWLDVGMIGIVTPRGETITNRELDGAEDDWKSFSFASPSGMQRMNVNGRHSVVSHTASRVADWHYVSVIPTEIFVSRARFVRRTVIIVVAVAMVLGVVISYVFSRRNYDPIARLARSFTSEDETNLEPRYRELKLIQESFLTAVHERDDAVNRLDAQSRILRRNYITRLLQGRIGSRVPIEEAKRRYALEFVGDQFATVLLFHPDFGSVLFGTPSHEEQPDPLASEDLLASVETLLRAPTARAYPVEIESMVVCLVNLHPSNHASSREHLEEVVAAWNDRLQSFNEGAYSLVASDVHTGLQSVPESYQEALETMEFRLLTDNSSVSYFWNLYPNGRQLFSFSYYLEDEQRFINHIRAGEYRSAIEVLERLFESVTTESLPSTQLIKCRVFGLMNTMVNALSEIRVFCDENFFEDNRIFDAMVGSSSVDAMHQTMRAALEQAEQFVSRRHADRSRSLKDRIIEYINASYTDPNLNVSTVADHFGISVSYVSRFFKKHAGCGLLDFIHRRRITEAKRRLTETAESIKTVSESVGYTNDISFIRTFKRYEGVTPGTYREHPA